MVQRYASARVTPLTHSGPHFSVRGLAPQDPDLAGHPDDLSSSTFRAIERAKQEWEATADALPELICLVDARGLIMRANRTIETWNLGRVVAVKDLSLHRLLHPACAGASCELERGLRQVRLSASAGQSAQFEMWDALLRRHLLVSARLVAGGRGLSPSATVVVIQDVTERKRAEEALRLSAERLRAMNDIQQAILAAHSPEGIAEAALTRMLRLVPFRHARVTLYDPDLNEFFVVAADANGGARLRPGQSYREDVFQSCDGREPRVFYAIEDLGKLANVSAVEEQLLSDGIRAYFNIPLIAEREFIGSLAIGADRPGWFTAEHIEIGREIADLLAIATRQAQLYGKLKRANQDLGAALQAKEEMIKAVSHELRTPLIIIKGYVDLLSEGMLGALNQEQVDAMAALDTHANRLTTLVNQVLTLKEIETSRLSKMTLDPAAWLGEVVRAWNLLIERGWLRINLEVSPDLPRLLADPNLLNQVMYNLLGNAVKFSPHGGAITIRAWATSQEFVLAIADCGIGIPSDKLELIFERFYRIHTGLNTAFGGLGIGLALCRAIVSAHGGRIWAESGGEGQGSTFYVALPVEAAEQTRPSAG